MFRAKNKHKNSAKKSTALAGASILVLALLAPVGLVLAVSVTGVERVSVDSSGTEVSGGHSNFPAISADSRYVAFHSSATNLVDGDTNGTFDIFVYDRQEGTTERVSVDSSGVEGDGGSYIPAISADGRYVTFYSLATNLVDGDTNGTFDVFVYDRQTDTTERVSVASDGAEAIGGSHYPAISADGRYVVFESDAANLVGGDSNSIQDIFVHDRQTGVTERVSVDSGGAEPNNSSFNPAISADGRYVSFESAATNLVSGDTNADGDIFVHDRSADTTERVSINSSGAEASGGWSGNPAISADGRYVVFESSATNLVSGDENSARDIFVHDRESGTTERVSASSSGVEGDDSSNDAVISADGRYVTFESAATNLVSGDSNGGLDVFVHDQLTNATELVSVDSNGTQTNGISENPAISADGRYVTFESAATNLVASDTNGTSDIFVVSLQLSSTVEQTIENAALNDGDANNDGTADALQNNVASIVSSVSNDYVVVEADTTDCVWGHITTASVTAATTEDTDGYTYPAGLTTFTLQCGEVGATVTMTHHYYGNYDPNSLILRKYSTTSNTYSTITDASLSNVTIGGQTALQVTYQVTDGGPLDEDGIANGTIVDPVGLAQTVESTVGAPTTGIPQQSLVGAYTVLLVGMGLIGYAAARYYRTGKKPLESLKA